MAGWVIAFVSSSGYLAIVALMFVENVFPPIPSELIMPLAGYLAAQDKLTLIGVGLARHRRLHAWRASVLLPWLHAWRKAPEVVCPKARPVVDAVARRHRKVQELVRQTLAYTAIGTAIWTVALAYLGYLLESNFSEVGKYLDPVSWIVFPVLAVIYLYRLFKRH